MLETMLNVNPPTGGSEFRFRAMQAWLASFFMEWPVDREIHR